MRAAPPTICHNAFPRHPARCHQDSLIYLLSSGGKFERASAELPRARSTILPARHAARGSTAPPRWIHRAGRSPSARCADIGQRVRCGWHLVP